MMVQPTSFYVDRKPVVELVERLLPMDTPDLADLLKVSPVLKQYFRAYCITRVQANVRYKDPGKCSVLAVCLDSLRSSFSAIVVDFMALLLAAQRRVRRDKRAEGACPVCLEPDCGFTLSCCRQPIHHACNEACVLQGIQGCPLCRQ